MVRLINNLYGKDKMAVLPFDSISLTTRLQDCANNTHSIRGGLSLIHFECAALSREIDSRVPHMGLGSVVWGHKIWHQCFFTPLSIFIFFVLQAMSRINGISLNKIKVTPNECGITALGNKEICEKTHHLNFSIVRKHLLRLASLSSNQIKV